MIQVNGNIIEVSLKQYSGELTVVDGSTDMPANQWILTRLAQLPLLAGRLMSTVALTRPFVTPEADLLQSLEVNPGEESEHVEDALAATLKVLDNRSPLETTVLYITSDAGEGKTSLINELAQRQAERFKEHKSDWLLLPIPLGGRTFLRFDDITVGVLQNKYRFPFLYYGSFLELVRLGVLIPAYDGFEEMLVESTSGEALSAMGFLVNSLQSCGAMVVAARKAYFEFENLKTQARLRDLISSYLVGFGKLALCRWRKAQFLKYCGERDLPNPEALYDAAVRRLGPTHSLITRPVLVRRLVDIAERSSSLDDFLTQLETSGTDFFSVFVRGIIQREAHDVWIERGDGEVKQPLLSIDEHCELLSLIALEMWQARVDFLKLDSLEFVTEFFCEAKRKRPSSAAQVRERIKGHALLIASTETQRAIEFDHDEFRQFFLGEAVANICLSQASSVRADLLNALRKGVFPAPSLRSLVQAVRRTAQSQRQQVVKLLAEVAQLDGQASFTHENCTSLVLALLNDENGAEAVLRGMSFPLNALRNARLRRVIFDDCFFAQSSLENTSLQDCRFTRCQFAKLDVYDSTRVSNVLLERESKVDVLFIVNHGVTLFEPHAVRIQLMQHGFIIPEASAEPPMEPVQPVKKAESLILFERLLRSFVRSTHISDSVIKLKLGAKAHWFMEEIVPILLKEGIFVEFEHRGGGVNRHFKLGRSMEALNQAMEGCGGSFDAFVRQTTHHRVTE